MTWPLNEHLQCEHPLGCPFVFEDERCFFRCCLTDRREADAKAEREKDKSDG